ncbi:hypothetical protein B0H16DRAFT_1757534 [Mycena metata]|uniref:Thiaminase-2/PQQC domain-containing protein n=1 Tax=Mycena metata TaxID=1033252 RepID=A0AAD7N0Y8_9AGAR|nr:hypothetical protein B0H16DRAFT_1757534 [Mycena metata]
MSGHPVTQEDELISIADAALTAAEADAATKQPTYISSRMASNTQNSNLYESTSRWLIRGKRAFSWVSLVKDELSRAGLYPKQPLPASPASTASATSLPSTVSAASPPSTASAASPPSEASAASPGTAGGTLPPRPQVSDAVAELLRKNQKAFDDVINHPFPRALGEGTASLDGFRHYMIQDWLYLKTCTQLKFTALGTAVYGKEVEGFDVRYKVEYTNKLVEICGTMLGVPKSTMEATPRSVELDASERFYRKALQDDNAWLGYYVLLLPCVLTYWEIAKRLMNDPSTAKNVVYHRAWTELNYDDSSVGKYIKFINENIAAKGGVDQWNWTFNIACHLESQLFNTGLDAPTPFEIIPNGTYSIRTSSAQSLVLAVQDVTGLSQLPAGKGLAGYLPSDTGSSVVGKEETGRDDERWLVSATKTGYIFKNVGTGLYLGMSTAPDRGQYRVLQAVLDPYCWWINPSLRQPDQGPSVYQIHDSVNLRYTLHAAIEAASTDLSFTPITAHENLDAPCQMWSFGDYKFKQVQHAQVTPDDPKLAAEMKQLLDKHSNEITNLKAEMTESFAAMNLAFKKELQVERTKMQQQTIKLEEEKKALADGLAAAREETKKVQQETHHKIHERDTEFDFKMKEMETQVREGETKLRELEERFEKKMERMDQHGREGQMNLRYLEESFARKFMELEQAVHRRY